jgi:DNA-binding transcriptional ArsR family regulator
MNMNIGRWEWDLAPQPPDENIPAASDEERLIILRMLREKKISLEEAEKLLAALEGK